MEKYGPTRGRFLPTHVEPFFHFQNSVGDHTHIGIYIGDGLWYRFMAFYGIAFLPHSWHLRARLFAHAQPCGGAPGH